MANAFSVFKCHVFENARSLSQPLKNSASNHPTKLLSAARTRRLTTRNVLFEPARDASQSDILLGLAGGGARTHTILRSLDFESSASANSATPALADRSERIRDSRASSRSPRCRVRCPQRIRFARRRHDPLRTADTTADRAFANRAVAREFREESLRRANRTSIQATWRCLFLGLPL